MFVADPDKVDLEDFLNPDKEGLIIPIKPAGRGMKISDMIQQIPIKDLTEHFPAEMASFVSYSETVTGLHKDELKLTGSFELSRISELGTITVSP